MTLRLIVNADDLGLASFLDEGILLAAREGLVRSASLVAAGPSFETAVKAAREARLGIGVHLCLSGGLLPAAPPERVPSLLENGRLPVSWTGFVQRYATGAVRLEDVERELEAQVQKILDAGLVVDHVDGHQHLHVFPGVLDRVVGLCERHRIWAMRLPREPSAPTLKRGVLSMLSRGAAPLLPGWMRVPDSFRVPAESGRLRKDELVRLLEDLPDGVHELGCHPGAGDGRVPEDPEWKYAWADELAALTSREAAEVVARRGIQLIRFADL